MPPPPAVTLPITGMTCASCVGRVEKALARVPGVRHVAVNLATERAEVELSEPVSRAALVQAVTRAGYDIAPTSTDLAIGGMTCASCVGRVEKALARVPGVASATVNLATERATITGTADPADLIRAVEASGYDARAVDRRQVPKATDDSALRRDTLTAALLTAPVFVLEMGSHLIPALHHWVMATIGMRESWMLQAVLATLVLAFPGRRFLTKGLPALARGAPDMNALVAVGTLAAWGYSMVATLAPGLLPQGTAQVYFEAAAVIVTLILLGRWLEARARGQTSQAIRRLIGLQPATARVQRPGGPAEVPLESVMPGDLILLRPGERVPVDGTVTEGSSHIDESMLTGEPMPVGRAPGDPVTAGTINQTGALTFRATAVGADTVLARIVRMVEQAQASKLPVQAMVDRVTLWFVPAVMALAGLTFVAWLALGPSLSLALVNAVAVLIVACPCAMGLATPTSILVGTGRGAELGVLFRQGAALQRLRDARVVAVDKTGTLTLGRPELTDLDMTPGMDRAQVLTRIAAVEALSEHPLARAIVAAAPSPLPPATAFASLTGQGVAAIVEGENVAIGSARYMASLGIDPAPFADTAARLAGDGKSPLYAAIGGRLAAVLAVADVLRDTTPAAIRALHDLGLTVAMITGDDARTAQAIARRLGIDHVVAEVLPEGKVEAVHALRTLHGPVAFVGDGINDAPALAAADVGIAVGSGTDVAIEAADVVLMRGGLAGVPTAIALSQAVIRNIRQNLFWAFAYNAALIPLAAGALYPATGLLMSPIFAAGAMAASSIFVLTNALRLRGFQGAVP